MALFSGFHFPIFNKARSAIGAPQQATPSGAMPLVDKSGQVGTMTTFHGAGLDSEQRKEAGLTPLPKITVVDDPARINRVNPTALEPFHRSQRLAVAILGENVFTKDGKVNRPIFNHRIPQSLVNSVLDRAEKDGNGPLWTAQDIADEQADLVGWNHCQNKLSEFHWDMSRKILKSDMQKFAESTSRGESPTPPVPMTEDMIVKCRSAVRSALADISTRVHARLLPKCLRIREAATDMAQELFIAEKAQAAKLGFAFEASATLRALVFISIKAWEDPIEWFLPGTTACLSPQSLFFGRRLFDAPIFSPTVDPTAAIEARISKDIEAHKAEIGRKKALEGIQKEKEHAGEVAALNSLHDSLRESCGKDAEKLRQERLAHQARNAPPVRVIQVKE